MRIDLASIVQQYGYLALFVGAILEGESILILGGLAAHRGYLQLPIVLVLAALGGFIGDQLCFGAGRFLNTRLVGRFPSLVPKIARIDRLISRHPALTVITIRFLYGFRIAGPITIGMTSMPWMRFSILNLIGAIVWAATIVGVGYIFGHIAYEKFLLYEVKIGGILLLIILVIYFSCRKK